MLYTASTIKSPAEHLQYLLKAFAIFNISIWYDDIVVHKDLPDAVGIMWINCGNNIGF